MYSTNECPESDEQVRCDADDLKGFTWYNVVFILNWAGIRMRRMNFSHHDSCLLLNVYFGHIQGEFAVRVTAKVKKNF